MANSGRPRKCDPKVENLHSNIRMENFSDAKQTLIEFGIDAKDGDGRTALIHAVFENKASFIEWLLRNGSDINSQDRNGYTALHFAAQNLDIKNAELLLKNGANPNLQDKYGNSPLWTAVFSSMGKDISIVKLLVSHNANPDSVNNYGASPKTLYKERYNTDLE